MTAETTAVEMMKKIILYEMGHEDKIKKKISFKVGQNC